MPGFPVPLHRQRDSPVVRLARAGLKDLSYFLADFFAVATRSYACSGFESVRASGLRAATEHSDIVLRKTQPPKEAFMENVTTITSGTLIAADKVQGTSVYNPSGDKLGSVEDVMIDKVSGRIIYALMSFGGFLGMGEDYHPLPWSTLKYDTNQGGYVVNLTKEQFEGAPLLARDGDFKWTPEYGRKVDEFYSAPNYWL
jgi:sporulation protein YlmC with PRC-barrel domain